MPTYRVEDSLSGKVLDIEGDSPPTDAELVEIFRQYTAPAQETQSETKLSDFIPSKETIAGAVKTAAETIPPFTAITKAAEMATTIRSQGPLVKLPVVGAPETTTRGLSKVASGVVEGAQSAEGIGVLAASKIPGANLLIGPVMAAAATMEAAQKLREYSVTGNKETLGEAIGYGTLGIGAGLLGVRDFKEFHTEIPPVIKNTAPATAAALERTVIDNVAKTTERVSEVENKPATPAVKESTPTPDTGMESAVMDAISEGGMVQGIKRGADKSGHYVVAPPEFAGDSWFAAGPFDGLESAKDFLDAEVGAPGAKVVFFDPQKNKPPLLTAGEAPEVPAPAAAAVSEAKPTGVTAPEVPPAISETTTTVQTPQPNGPTSIKNAVVNAEREQRGLDALETVGKRSFPDVWDEAKARVESDPGLPERLMTEIEKQPRALRDVEDAVLLRERVRVRSAYYDAASELSKAVDDGLTDQVADAQAKVAQWETALSRLDSVTKSAGTETGRGLNARKMMANADFTLDKLVLQKRAANGGRKLTTDETIQLKKVADEYAAKNKELERLLSEEQGKVAELESQRVFTEMQAKAKAEGPVMQIAERIVSALEGQAQKARERLAGKFLTPSPQDLLDTAIIGASHIARLGLDFAKWSEAMIKDVGQGIKPYLDEIYVASQKQLDVIAKKVAPVGYQKKAKERVSQGKASAEDSAAKIKSKADEEGLSGIGGEVQKLARQFVSEGVRNRDELIDKVHGVLAQVFPEITRSQTRDAISGYGQFKQLTKDEISTALRDLKGQMQQIGKLEDMAAGQAPKKTGIERRTPSDEERRLIKQVNEKKKEGGFESTDPATRLRSALETVKTRLENQIKDLSYQIENKAKIVKKRNPSPSDDEVVALRTKRDALREQYDAMFPKEPISDAVRLERWKARTQASIAKYEKKIVAGDFTTRKPKPVELDKEAQNLAFEKDEIVRKFNEGVLKDKLAQRKMPERVIDTIREIVNLQRSILTSPDVSGVGRQGGFITLAHPARGLRTLVASLKSFRSAKNQHAIELGIREDPNYPVAKRAGLEFTESGTSLTKMEEAYQSRWAEKVPLVAGSQRAYQTGLNRLRMDSFNAMASTLSRDGHNLSPIEARVIANFINKATGRGTIGIKDNLAAGLNTVFFAPRFVASRFQLAIGQPLWYGLFKGGMSLRETAKVRTLIAGEYLRYLMGISTVYGLGLLAGGELEYDPRSSDAFKLKFWNTRVDPLSGIQQVVVFGTREISGESKSIRSGKVLPLRGPNVPYGGQTGSTVAGRFLWSKLSPSTGALVDVMAGENVVGEPTTPLSLAKKTLVPINLQDVKELADEQGIPRAVLFQLLQMGGWGVNTFDPSERRK